MAELAVFVRCFVTTGDIFSIFHDFFSLGELTFFHANYGRVHSSACHSSEFPTVAKTRLRLTTDNRLTEKFLAIVGL